MRITKTLLFLVNILLLGSCNNHHADKPTIAYSAFQVTDGGDTINRMNDKGKQGRWEYKNAEGTISDTMFIDGVPQNH